MKGSASPVGADAVECTTSRTAALTAAGFGLLALVALALQPLPVFAQGAPTPARSTHARAHPDRDLLLRLDSVVLLVPVGAVASGAVVGLGVGGVPDTTGGLGGTGIVVTAAGGLRGDVAVLLAPTAADRAVIAADGGTPALIDTASGEHRACLSAVTDGRTSLPTPSIGGGVGGGGLYTWVACPVGRPGAYVVGGVSGPPPSDPLLRGALTRIPPASAARRLPAWGLLLMVAAAAGLGAAGALLLGGRPRST